MTPLASIVRCRGGLPQEIKAGAHHLRLAAQAIGILHALVACEMRQRECRCPSSNARKAARDLDLARHGRRSAWMRGSKRRVEALAASTDSAPVTSAAPNSVSALEQAGNRVGGRELRTVDQREPFLGPERRSARARLRRAPSRRGTTLAVDERPPSPIMTAAICASGARSPDAPTDPCYGTTGITPRASMAWSCSMSFAAHARGALRETDDLQRHHQPHRSVRALVSPTPAAMRQNDVALKLATSGRRDALDRQFAEAGIDAVDRARRARRCAPRQPRPRPRAARWKRSTATAAPRQIARQSASDASPAKRMIDGHRPLQTRRVQWVEAEPVDELGRPVDVPDREIAPFAGFERAGLARKAQRARAFAGHAGEAFVNGHPEQRRAPYSCASRSEVSGELPGLQSVAMRHRHAVGAEQRRPAARVVSRMK